MDATNANFHIAKNSPARGAGVSNVDQGAFPWNGTDLDPGTGLRGQVTVDTALSGTVTLTGDVVVASGVTLSIAPGTILNIASSDAMAANADTGRIELIVKGTLSAPGTVGSPITFTGAGGTSSWYGISVQSGGSATLSSLVLSGMSNGISNGGSLSLSNSTITNSSAGLRLGANSTVTNVGISGTYLGVSVTGGTNTVTGLTVTGATNAFDASSGTTTLTSSLLYGNSTISSYYGVVRASGGVINVDRCTIANNTGTANGVYVYTGTITATSSIIASNPGVGVGNYAGTLNTTYSNVWGNTGGNGVTAGSNNNLSTNPQFVNAGSADFHLQATSPSRGAGVASIDQGAFPYSVGALDHLVLTPSPAAVTVGGVVGFSVQGFDAQNNPVTLSSVTWSATAAAGTITTSGVLTASCTPATATNGVTATSGGKSVSANVVISAGALASLVVTPASATVKAQATKTFSVAGVDVCGNTVSSPSVTWSVGSGGAAGSINAGLFTAGCTPGTYANTIIASTGSITGTASVTVTEGDLAHLSISPTSATVPAGGQQQFTGSATDACGTSLSPVLSWASSVTGGSVSSSGLLTAGTSAGTFATGVTVSSGGFSASASVTVQGGSVASVAVSPSSTTLSVGGTQQFTAVAKDASNNVVTAPVTWSVTNGGGTITAGGLFTAGTAAGAFAGTVTATIGGVEGHAGVTVTPGPASKLTLNPTSISIAPGGSTTFTALVQDAAGNPITAPITWSASSGGTITSGGVFTAGTSSGTFPAAVTATGAGLSASADVTVSAGALSQLVVSPSVASVPAGNTVAFVVQGKDVNGNTVAVSPTWSVVHGGGTISPAGIFTAGNQSGTFANTVKVEASGLSAFASVSISAGPAVVIEITPNYPQVEVSQQVQFTAQARDAFGNAVPAAITWASLPAAGSINAAGLFTAGHTPGDFTMAVSAQSGGLTGLANVRVLPAQGTDGGAGTDAGMTVDAGTDDAGMTTPDAGSTDDAGLPAGPDAGDGITGSNHGSGCSCNSVDGLLPFALLGLLSLRRRASRR
jgi:hypothetical protein